ncbi:Rossmann-fold NAD(P)-binding domain-containing protein [Streptomyces griseiscabiei]|uniref:Uncharacterized protein n=1 Tax=Streptomyces griseiscabiei TaxID=2993540 RepID=A0ABU4L670_9ACTN|nr:hypothetical protein [Streptomyces griseiscabiei]MBZ3906178.1 hypothetical protein [Streptomyces griseiscabiei]MDX2911173.1 hypothetical protein [Streptomyces griseiscabiei]
MADAADAVPSRPDDHAGMTYGPTGPESLSPDDAALIRSEQLGGAVTYRTETVEKADVVRATAR